MVFAIQFDLFCFFNIETKINVNWIGFYWLLDSNNWLYCKRSSNLEVTFLLPKTCMCIYHTYGFSNTTFSYMQWWLMMVGENRKYGICEIRLLRETGIELKINCSSLTNCIKVFMICWMSFILFCFFAVFKSIVSTCSFHSYKDVH